MQHVEHPKKQFKILLGVTAGIAAYKAIELCRLCTKQGYQVQVVMTPEAKHFVGELSFQAVTGSMVRSTLFDTAHEAAMGHIELARWADLILIAPASADFIAKLRVGIAENLLQTICLASTAPIAIAPAMNQNMWKNAATQANIHHLQQRGVQIWGPVVGDQACGDDGPGRMLEPSTLVEQVSNYQLPCAQKTPTVLKALVTAGPTYEPLDPVRFIGNRSSGKMGFALVQALLDRGVHVILITGPVSLTSPKECQRINVSTAAEMHTEVMRHVQQVDIFISCAAVADYRPATVSMQKMKKKTETMQLTLVKTPDILQSVTSLSKKPFCVGFAAETENLAQYAERKGKNKQVDMIAANSVHAGEGFDQDHNALLVLWDKGKKCLPKQPKSRLAKQLIELIMENLHAKNTAKTSG